MKKEIYPSSKSTNCNIVTIYLFDKWHTKIFKRIKYFFTKCPKMLLTNSFKI